MTDAFGSDLPANPAEILPDSSGAACWQRSRAPNGFGPAVRLPKVALIGTWQDPERGAP
jgi:hypothetical protein